jgi:hypothetical protein
MRDIPRGTLCILKKLSLIIKLLFRCQTAKISMLIKSARQTIFEGEKGKLRRSAKAIFWRRGCFSISMSTIDKFFITLSILMFGGENQSHKFAFPYIKFHLSCFNNLFKFTLLQSWRYVQP